MRGLFKEKEIHSLNQCGLTLTPTHTQVQTGVAWITCHRSPASGKIRVVMGLALVSCKEN